MPRRSHFKCTIEGCDRKHYAKGFCSCHYSRRLRVRKMAGPVYDPNRLVGETWPASLIEAVREASESLSQNKIAARLGCSAATVGRIQKRHGIAPYWRRKVSSVAALVPPWVPGHLAERYRIKARTSGEHVAATWARAQKHASAPA